MPEIRVRPVEGIGEITPGTALAGLVIDAQPGDGDIVLVTSKIVSKAEGMARRMERADAVDLDAVRVVARPGQTRITENHLGLTMAASGVDSSNVEVGTVLLLPRDPDGTARSIRDEVYAESGRNVAVLITDTAGRPWRNGQTDIAIGLAGLEPLQVFAGQSDQHGNDLVVTAPAIADELAGAGEIATGKLGQAPLAIVSGLAHLVLAPNDHGPGARALIRDREADMFALGTREAVLAALHGDQLDCFGSPAPVEEVHAALTALNISLDPAAHDDGDLACVVRNDGEALIVTLLARAHAWEIAEHHPARILLRPRRSPATT